VPLQAHDLYPMRAAVRASTRARVARVAAPVVQGDDRMAVAFRRQVADQLQHAVFRLRGLERIDDVHDERRAAGRTGQGGRCRLAGIHHPHGRARQHLVHGQARRGEGIRKRSKGIMGHSTLVVGRPRRGASSRLYCAAKRRFSHTGAPLRPLKNVADSCSG